MTDVAATVASFRRAVELLAELDDPAATRTAAALSRWLAGEDFDSATNLPPGWRHHVQQKDLDATLQALVALFPNLAYAALARRIVAGLKRAGSARGARPDGERGLYHDLAHAGFDTTESTCRRRLAEIAGKRNAVLRQAAASTFYETGE
jgi:hypothetical protein